MYDIINFRQVLQSLGPSSAIPRLKDVRHGGKATAHLGALRPIVPRLPPPCSTTRSRAPLAQPALHPLRVPQAVSEQARQIVFLSVSATAVRCARSKARAAQFRNVDASYCVQLARRGPPHDAHQAQAQAQGGYQRRKVDCARCVESLG